MKQLKAQEEGKPSESVAEKSTVEQSSDAPSSWLSGWRLKVLTFSLCLGLFLSSVDTSIVSTSIVSITNDLGDFSRSSWIVSAYMLTYTGFLIPLVKLSDIYGRRNILALSTLMFSAFSAGAGWSRTMVELCVFRALQGIGSGGIYGLSFVILPEMVAPEQYTLYSAILSAVGAVSALFGPLVGGAINNSHSSDWRWIFWINIPAGAISLVLSWIALPPGFPCHLADKERRPKSSFRRFDLLGAFLLVAGGILFVGGLEVGGTQYAWSNAIPISLLCVGLVLWILLVAWEWHQSRRALQAEPVFPWRVLTNRFNMGDILSALFTGAALLTTIVELPQQFQIVDQTSPLMAGVRLLALMLSNPVGSALAGVFIQKLKIPFVYIVAAGSLVQVLGLGLYTGLDAGNTGSDREQYAFQVIMGLGFGVSLATAIMIAPVVFEPRDLSVGMGAISQFRILGGSIGIAASASILNKRLASDLSGQITPEQLALLQRSAAALDDLPAATAQAFRDSYSRGMKQVMCFITAMSAASIIGALFMFERKPRRVK